jgi:hypothetical protein
VRNDQLVDPVRSGAIWQIALHRQHGVGIEACAPEAGLGIQPLRDIAGLEGDRSRLPDSHPMDPRELTKRRRRASIIYDGRAHQ